MHHAALVSLNKAPGLAAGFKGRLLRAQLAVHVNVTDTASVCVGLRTMAYRLWSGGLWLIGWICVSVQSRGQRSAYRNMATTPPSRRRRGGGDAEP